MYKWKNSRKSTVYDFLLIGMGLLFFMQAGIILYVNLVQLKYHLGYDASSYLIKAIEVWKQKTLFIDHWNHQTTLYIDNAMPLAALLYGITRNIMLSYGIANCIVSGVLIAVFYKLCKSLNFDTITSFLCLNLLMCPYLMEGLNNWNDLGYFSMMFTSMASYGVKTITVLMMIKAVIDLENEKIHIIFLGFTAALCFLAGLSSGLYIAVTVLIPCFLYIAVKVFVKNEIREGCNKQTVFVTFCLAVLFIGKIVSEKILLFTSLDSEMIWVGLSQFFANLTSIFVGFLQLLGALPEGTDREIMSREGIIYVFSFFIVIVCLMAIAAAVCKILKNYEKNKQTTLFVLTVAFNVFLFMIVYTTYGAGMFETRYLIEPYMAVIILIGYFVYQMDSKLLFKQVLVAAMIGSILIIDLKSNYTYTTTLNNYDELSQIVDKVNKLDSPVVYLVGDDIMCEQRVLRPMDTSKIYKSFNEIGNVHHYGDYTYYDENGEYAGPTVMIATEESYPKIAEHIKNAYSYYDEVGMYKIYTSEVNILDNKAGITQAPLNIDYPYTHGIVMQNGRLNEEGAYVSDGTKGDIMRGPNTTARKGTYDITLHYELTECREETAAVFSVLINDGGQSIASADIKNNQEQSITLEDVTFENEEDTMEYLLSANDGTKIKIISVEIQEKK